jgi:hypothetical protein
MADLERGRQSSTSRWWLAVAAAALVLGVLLGLFVPHPNRWLGPSPPPSESSGPAAPFVLSEWEYPGTESHGQLKCGSTEGTAGTAFLPELYAYSTPDALEKVWSHYAKLAGIEDQEFKPGNSSVGGSFKASAGGWNRPVNIAGEGTLYYTGSAGDKRRQSVQTATIVLGRPGYTAAVVLTRGRDEARTYIEVVVEKKSPLP